MLTLELLVSFGAPLAAFLAGVLFSQKIKDWFKGIPSEVRATLNGVETSAVGTIKRAQSDVLSKIITALPAPTKPEVVSTAQAPAPVAQPAAPAA